MSDDREGDPSSLGRLRIGSRGSELSRVQTDRVAEAIAALEGAPSIRLVPLSSRGDRLVDQPLTAALGQGFFTSEIERALLDGEIDLAVHSLKDLATVDPAGLVLAAIPEREDPRDALVSAGGETLEELPKQARVGTSSLRRRAFLLHQRPDLVPVDLRGNVPTRLEKLDKASDYDAVVLAAAGLKRLGLEGRISQLLSAKQLPPAPGQGALAVQARCADASVLRWVEPLDEARWRLEVTAERSLLSALEAGCQAPIGALARLRDGRLRLFAAVATLDGGRVVGDELVEQDPDSPSAAQRLGRELGRRLLERGAGEILEELRGSQPRQERDETRA